MSDERKTGDVFLSLDLELNQPSGNIIQIGAVAGNVRTGEIVGEFNRSVKLPEGEVVSEFIHTLTNISQKDLDTQGISLIEAYRELALFHKQHGCFVNPITWGGGDTEEIRKQLHIQSEAAQEEWAFGRRWIDAKTLYISLRIARGESVQSGLSKSMGRMGLQFKGRKHNALDDARNTFFMYLALLKVLKENSTHKAV